MVPVALALLMSIDGAKPASMNELATAIAGITKRPSLAVLPSYDTVSLPSEPKEVDDIVSPLRRQGFASLVSDVAIVYQQGIPRSHWGVLKGLIEKTPKADKQFKQVNIPQTSVKNDLITFETKDNEAIKLSSLTTLELPRRIMISPYFNSDNGTDFPLAMKATNMAPGDFMKALTRGLGGKLDITNKMYTIGFDASNFKNNFKTLFNLAQQGVNEGRSPSQVTNTYNGGSYQDYQEYQEAAQGAAATSKPALTAALNVLSQTLSQMPDNLVEQTFAYKGTTTRLNMATYSSLQNPIIAYLNAASTGSTTPAAGADVQRQQGRRAQPNYANVISRVDPRNPGRISITTDFRISVELNLMSARNRNAEGNSITIQIL